MTKLATIILGAALLLAVACATPEPVIQEVEVTRLVPQTVEVPVEVVKEVQAEVTRIVKQTVGVPVTRVVEQKVEVTRMVRQEVPVTVVVTATPPPATPTPVTTPTPTPMPINLATTTRANAWIYLTNNEYGWLRVEGDPAFNVDTYDFDVFVDGDDCSNDARLYGDEGGLELVCGVIEKRHTSVRNVSIQTPNGDLRCARNDSSDSSETVFACAWR